MGVDESGQKDAAYPLDPRAGVARKDVAARSYVEDRAFFIEHDRGITERSFFAEDDGVGADDTHAHVGWPSQS